LNFYGLKSKLEVICVSYFCLLSFISFSSHIVIAIQEKAQPCQFLLYKKPDLTQQWWYTLKWDDFSPTKYSMVGTSAF